ncbi:hypothetical protein CHS0354_005319 [Potamilus streckersoni]|uniref:Uncharacterized protein n=1 Tax=Potamilus streckersoni TaxID=2493646 RepID=A0AAE0SG33_9BIVA|nr:hypothetical protein CHS0354_005319 [Potamilus streckersoni]
MREFVCLIQVTLLFTSVLADLNLLLDNSRDDWEPLFRIYGGGKWDSRDDFVKPFKSMDDDHDDKDRAQFRSFEMDKWENDGIKKVKMELYDDGRKVHELEFDGDTSNKTNWFSPQKLKSSSWTDLSGHFTGDEFSVDGDDDDDHHWTIRNRKSRTCDEEGWLTIIDRPKNGRNRCLCNYEDVDEFPTVLYAKGPTKTKWSSGNYGKADMVQISISRIPYQAPQPLPQPLPQPQPQPPVMMTAPPQQPQIIFGGEW